MELIKCITFDKKAQESLPQRIKEDESDRESEQNKADLINEFINNQSLVSIQNMKNEGLNIFKMKGGYWVKMDRYSLPFNKDRIVKLYNDQHKLVGCAVF